MFGSSTAPKPTTSGIFGSAPLSASPFQTSGSNNAFGSSAFNTTNFAPSSSTPFGTTNQQPQQPQQPQQQSGLFGQSTGLFGSTSASTAPTGNSLFGGPTNTLSNTSNLFNPQQPQQQQQQQQSTGLFGSNSLFRPTTAPSATTPLPTNTSSSLFGSNTGGGLGGSTMTSGASSNLFNRPSSGVGAFSFNSNQQSTANNPTTSAFPTTTSGSNISNSLFSSQPQSNLYQQQQQQFQPLQSSSTTNFPSISPAGSGSLSLAPPLPAIYATKPPSSAPQNEPQSATPRSPVKFTPRTSFRIKPREAYNLTAPIPFGNGTSNSSSTTTTGTVLVPRKLAGSLNIKKLVIPEFNANNLHDEDEEYLDTNSYASPKASTSSLSPSNQYNNTTNTSNVNNANNSSNILTDSMPFGHQFTFPPIKVLMGMSANERSEIKNFVIGQKGIGEIRFLLPVDLSEIEPENIFGHLIEFCDGEAVLYPDLSIPIPDPGKGLNVPAQVRLERIWTLSKNSRDPITDPRSEKVALFTQKLKETEGTHFVSYEPATGTWIFTVDHF